MQTQSSHQAYRSRGKSFRPTIDRDVLSSSIDFAIATSLIQCVNFFLCLKDEDIGHNVIVRESLECLS